MAPDASLSTSAFELDKPLAGKELRICVSLEASEEAATFAVVALGCALDVGAGTGEVIYDVDRRTSGSWVAIACPSGRRKVTAGAVCVKTVGCIGAMMIAVAAFANGSLKVVCG